MGSELVLPGDSTSLDIRFVECGELAVGEQALAGGVTDARGRISALGN